MPSATKIERIDRWVKTSKGERRVRTFRVNGIEYKLLRDAKDAHLHEVRKQR